MKRTVPTWLALTILMLLLVASATIFFVFQTRDTALTQRDAFSDEVDHLSGTVTILDERVAQRESDLASAEAQRDVLQGELDAVVPAATRVAGEREMAETEAEQLQAALDSAEATTEALLTPTPSVPQLAFNAPADGATVTVSEPVTITLAVMDPVGVAEVEISADDDLLYTADLANRSLAAVQTIWTPAMTGTVTLQATASNSEGRAADPVSIRVQVQTPDAAAAASAALRATNTALRAAIEADVSEIRGLTPLAPVEPTFLNQAQLRERFETIIAEETTPEDARAAALVFAAFDFLPRDFDYYGALIDLYSGGVAGFYDEETDEFVVVSNDDVLDIGEQVTHAHEFVHALQDQYYDLGALLPDEIDGDAASAISALVEGDATLVETIYLLQYLSPDQFAEFLAEASSQPDLLANAPQILVNGLLFPYINGMEFVQALFEQGGFAAIDAAYVDPPRSTEHILHPDRYLAGDAPLPQTLPPLTATLGTGWQLLDEDTLGEFYVREYLIQQVRAADAETAAAGWGGDRYAVYWNADEEALVMVLSAEWDTNADADEFAATFEQYAAAAYGGARVSDDDGLVCWRGEETVCFLADSRRTIVVRGPDEATADLVLADTAREAGLR